MFRQLVGLYLVLVARGLDLQLRVDATARASASACAMHRFRRGRREVTRGCLASAPLRPAATLRDFHGPPHLDDSIRPILQARLKARLSLSFDSSIFDSCLVIFDSLLIAECRFLIAP
jgi:hypothetical protein